MITYLIRVSVSALFLFLFLWPSKVLAVSINLSSVPSQINTLDSFSFNVSVSGASNGTNYLRVDLYKSGSTNYFGETYNNSAWYGASTGTQYLPITISNSSWSGSVQGRIGNPSQTEFPGAGTYILKIRRYTNSGNPSSGDQQTPVSLEITVASASPTPSPLPSPTPTPTPSSSPAQTFAVSSLPSSINSIDPYTLSIQLANFTANTQYYLKGAFQKSGSSNYFGLTKVGSSWIKNSQTYSSQLPITTDSSGNWSGNLEIKVDSDDSGFTSSGDYIFKVARYLSTSSTANWSSAQTVSVTSSSTVTPTPSPTDSVLVEEELPNTSPPTDPSPVISSSSFVLPTLSSNSATVAGIAIANTRSETKIASSKIAIIPTIFGVLLVAGSSAFFALKHFSLAFFKKLP